MTHPNPPSELAPEGIHIVNSFIRGRNVLITEADFSALFVDFFIHLQEHAITAPAEVVTQFRDFLAAFTLHAASHPRNEVLAWTLQMQQPPRNLFFAADTEWSTVTGRFFTDGIKEEDSNVFYQDLKIHGKPLHRSIVPFHGVDTKATVEFYYSQSEQRPARFFHLGADRYALLSAHPDWDQQWLRNVSINDLLALHDRETVNELESRQFRWWCGCSTDKILQILKGPMQSDPHALFGDDDHITVNCPRCRAKYHISRQQLEAATN